MKKFRIVSYAINGRGIGHLVRQLAILRWMRRLAASLDVELETWVLTSSEADTLARVEGIPALKIPSKAMLRDAGLDPARSLAIIRAWVVQTIAGLQPDLLVVDTFPGGSAGELLAALELAPKRALVARPVKEQLQHAASFQALLPLYDKVLVPGDCGGTHADVAPILLRSREELPDRATARRALGVPEDALAVWLSLGGGGDPTAEAQMERILSLLRSPAPSQTNTNDGNNSLPPIWPVVAAGPLYRGLGQRGPGLTWVDRYGSMELLPGVDCAISAAGYNSVHELLHVGIPTIFLPQHKIADDQAARAERAVAAGAALVAPELSALPHLIRNLPAGAALAGRTLVPENGARLAAAQLLGLLLPDADLQQALRAWPPGLLASPSARRLPPNRLQALQRLTQGPTPSLHHERRSLLANLAEEGHSVPTLKARPPAGGDLLELLGAAEAANCPPEVLVSLTEQSQRHFAATSGEQLTTSMIQLLELLRPFQDWMGALALIRSLPTDRKLALGAALPLIRTWLAGETDLFDAQRRLLHLDGLERRSLAEVLSILGEQP